jgi:hypothetical protein
MKKLIYLCLVLAIVSSCKKDSDNDTPAPTNNTGNNNNNGSGTITINSPDQVSMKIDGVPTSKVADGINISADVGSYGNMDTPPDTSYGVYGSSLNSVSIAETYISIDKGRLYFLGWPASNTAFKTFFNPGAYSYATTPELGITISMYQNGVGWSTNNGSQSGSTFNITDMQEVTAGGSYGVKIRCTFSCKLYDSLGNVKTITEGIYVGHFENF